MPEIKEKGYIVSSSCGKTLACQAFTVLIRWDFHGSLTHIISQTNPQFPILICNNLRIALVHIPNIFAKQREGATHYLRGMVTQVDVIMGDTNIGSKRKIGSVGKQIWGEPPNHFPQGKATTAAMHPGPQGKGTNSRENALIDRGIANVFISQFGDSVVDHSAGVQGPQPAAQFLGFLGKKLKVNGHIITYTDHNGLVLSVPDEVIY